MHDAWLAEEEQCGVDVLEALGSRTPSSMGLTLAELASATGRDRGVLARMLSDLVALRIVERDASGRRHVLGWGLYATGVQLAQSRLTRFGSGTVQNVADACDETASLVVRVGPDAVTICEAAPTNRGVQVVNWIGRSYPLSRSDAALVLLAELPSSELDELIRDPLPPSTGRHAPRTAAALRSELSAARLASYAISDQHNDADVAAISAPVRDLTGEIVAALVVTGQSERVLAAKTDIAQSCVAEARRLSAELGGPEPGVQHGG